MTIVALAAEAWLVVCLGGCARSGLAEDSAHVTPVRVDAVYLPGESLWADGGSAGTDPGPDPGARWTRNDAGMNHRDARAQLALDAWPEPPRASLSRPRYIWLPRHPDSLIYFESDQRERRGRRW